MAQFGASFVAESSGHVFGPGQREQLAVRAGLLDCASDRRSRQYPVNVRGQRGVRIAVQRAEDLGVVEGGRRGAVGQREVVAGQPAVVAASGELAVQRGVGEVEGGVGLGDAVRVLGIAGVAVRRRRSFAPAW